MTIAISGLSRSGRILAAVEGALAVGAMLAAIAVAMGLHVSARQGAERELRRLAVVLAEQTSRTLQAIDLVLADVANEAEVVASEDPAHFRSIMATPAMQRALHARIAGLPQADAILVIDAAGQALLSSRAWPTVPVNVSDRAYFQAARDGTWRAPFLSEPVSNRETGSWVFHIVRCVPSRSGVLLGVLLGAIDLDYISGFHAAIGLPPGMGVALVRQDGVVLTHFPADMARDPGAAIPGLHVSAAGVVFRPASSPIFPPPSRSASATRPCSPTGAARQRGWPAAPPADCCAFCCFCAASSGSSTAWKRRGPRSTKNRRCSRPRLPTWIRA